MKQNKKYIHFLVVTLCLFVYRNVEAQISHDGIPISFTDTVCMPFNNIASVNMPFVDEDSLKTADSIERVTFISLANRIGFPIPVNLNMTNSGTWETLNDGSKIWRLVIHSSNAKYIMILYDHFELPKGSKFFVYNVDTSHVIGSFTKKNCRPHGKFSTQPVKGESIILEYNEPSVVPQQANISLSKVLHIYTTGQQGGFGQSDPCEINVFCPEGDDWCNQRRSVAMIISGNARICTGSLITNDRRDLRPYFLTAQHCMFIDPLDWTVDQFEIDEAEQWTFWFNYQSPVCADQNGPATFTLSGATLIANRYKSDFALFELDEKPPGDYNVYYNGWDNRNKRPKDGVSIHHPNGDIKKISTYKKNPDRKLCKDPLATNQHKTWRVKWIKDKGDTEHGSSGAPLFNQDKRVVGDLFGHANIKCDGTIGTCEKKARSYFGRFDKSWDDGPNAESRLKDHLSPTTTALLAMSGDEPCTTNWFFTNANDLHTSANVSFFGPLFPGSRTYNGVYEATNLIQASNNVNIQSGTDVVFDAGAAVRLLPGFHAQAGSSFHAFIEGCLSGCGNGFKMGGHEEEPVYVLASDTIDEPVDLNEFYDFNVYPNPNAGRFTIEFDADEDVQADIYVYSLLGKLVHQQSTHNDVVNVNISQEPKGIYLIRIIQGAETYTGKIIHQ